MWRCEAIAIRHAIPLSPASGKQLKPKACSPTTSTQSRDLGPRFDVATREFADIPVKRDEGGNRRRPVAMETSLLVAMTRCYNKRWVRGDISGP